MPMERTFRDLCGQCLELRDTLLGVRLTVVEDSTGRCDLALIDRLGDSVEETIGQVQELVQSAMEAHRCTQPPSDPERARQALTQCQECFFKIESEFSVLTSYETISEVVAAGVKRGGQWRKWAASARQSLEQCRPPLEAVRHALFLAWQEMAERSELIVLARAPLGIGDDRTEVSQ